MSGVVNLHEGHRIKVGAFHVNTRNARLRLSFVPVLSLTLVFSLLILQLFFPQKLFCNEY